MAGHRRTHRPGCGKHLEKRGLINVTDTAVASEMDCGLCRGYESKVLSFGRGSRSPKAPGEVAHTDLGGSIHADVMGTKYLQIFVDETIRDKHVVVLKTRDALASTTRAYIDEMAREGVAEERSSGDGAEELGRSVIFSDVC